MNIFLNDIPTKLPEDHMNLKDLLEWKQISPQGTAVALNDKLIKQDLWSVKSLNEGDHVTIITASFGG